MILGVIRYYWRARRASNLIRGKPVYYGAYRRGYCSMQVGSQENRVLPLCLPCIRRFIRPIA